MLLCSNFTLLEFNPFGDATFNMDILMLLFVVLFNDISAKLPSCFSELAVEVFLCLYFRVTRRFMLRMQRELV